MSAQPRAAQGNHVDRPAVDIHDGPRYPVRMTIVALTLPDDLGAALRIPTERLAAEIALAAATRLYEEGRVSLAKAAEIAGMDRFDFASRLVDQGLATATFDDGDVEAAREAAR